MKYYKIITKDDWFVIPVNDVWRARKMLSIDFVKAEFYREWRHPNSNRNKLTEYDAESYNKWKREINERQ
jgi:hypothetical protein